MHLATALWWQANFGEPLVVATYDRKLRRATKQQGLVVFPSVDP